MTFLACFVDDSSVAPFGRRRRTALVVLGAGCGDAEENAATDEPAATDDTDVTDDTKGPDESAATDDVVVAPLGPADAVPFADPAGSFTLGTGPDWVLRDEQIAGVSGATFWTVGPVSEGFGPNVNILVQPWPGNIEEYLDFSVEQAPNTPGVSDFRLIDRATVDGLGGELGVLRYTAFTSGLSLQFIGVAAVGDGEAVLATFTAPPGTFDELIGGVEPYLLTLEQT